MSTKHCNKCDTTKPVVDYHKNRGRPDGLNSQCKPCVITARRRYCLENPDKVRETNNKNYAKNRPARVEYRRRYYAENTEECLEASRKARESVTQRCSVEGCTRRAASHAEGSRCVTHAVRIHRKGEPGPAGYIDTTGLNHHCWGGDSISYGGAHDRVKRLYGSASDFECAHCGERQAVDWAYDHTDPDPSYAVKPCYRKPRKIPYSTDPSRYVQLCKPCHIRFDRKPDHNRTKEETAA